jgi:hypothetical protein
MKYFALTASLLIAMPALAQQPTPIDTARAAILTLEVDKNNLQTALLQAQQAVEALAAQNAVLAKHQADLDAYLAACGDHPGCTQPIAKGR